MKLLRQSLCLFALLPGVLSIAVQAEIKYPDLYEASILELQARLEKNQFTSVDLVKAYLARIDEVNLKGAKLHAVIETNPSALKQAADLDAERKKSGKRSALHGIPILLKDNIATLASEGMNTTAGSYALLKSIVPGDATVAAKLRKAGAILLGKANLSEWAHFRGTVASGWSGRGGQATNPYYPGADPCGSSSGSGVATAVGLAAGSLGTETDGSIICPSSYNNLVGIKPTVGLTSRAGVIPISSHQDTVGPMTRSVEDGAVILSVIAGRDSKDNYTSTAPAVIPDYTKYLNVDAIKGKRFGVPRAVFTDEDRAGNDPSINIAFNRSLETIRSLGGIIIDPADLPSADEIPGNANETIVLNVDFKIEINEYLKGLKSIPTGASTLAKLIAYNDAHKNLEEPKGYEDQSIFIDSQNTTGYDSKYYAALRADYELGRTRGIDAALKAHSLDALLLPSNGWTTSPAAIAGYPIVTVPLGFFPNSTIVTPRSAGPNTVFPAPGVPFGLAFLGTAYMMEGQPTPSSLATTMTGKQGGGYGLIALEWPKSRSLRWRYLVVALAAILLTGIFWLCPRTEVFEYPDLYEASILELQTGLDKGHFTSVDLVEAYLARIDEVNLKGPALRAVIETNPYALEQAAALDAERKKMGKRSVLHGIPIMLKDNIATLASEGEKQRMNTTAGSYALFKSVVPGDATVAEKLRKAGAILLGKANLSEWSQARGALPSGWSGRGGQATNPYYPGGDPCGSSSGSAISSAIGLATGSLGTETHGSIVCPSSYNNLVGIKPTVGLTSRSGVIPVTDHQDTVGPMTRSVADAAVILTLIAGRDDRDNYTLAAPAQVPDYTQYLDVNAIKGKRFGVPRIVFMNETLLENHPAIALAFDQALKTIKSLGGIIIDPADLPSAEEMVERSNEILVGRVDLKIKINAYLESLDYIPTGAATLAKIIAYNDAHKDLEEPEEFSDQAV
ncbi:hypothetical protein FRC07_012490 [Ceratobasidium sp. 392]|nr:hypothetical protein FRC07_012490 [Ceratobasidium sp. 392]